MKQTLIKGFTGEKYWRHNNPAYKSACFRKLSQELVELKTSYDYFVKRTSERDNKLKQQTKC